MFLYEFHMILCIKTNFFPTHYNGYKFCGCEAETENTYQMW